MKLQRFTQRSSKVIYTLAVITSLTNVLYFVIRWPRLPAALAVKREEGLRNATPLILSAQNSRSPDEDNPTTRPEFSENLTLEDIKAIKSKLEATGLPPFSIRAALVALIDRKFQQAQLRAIFPEGAGKRRWESTVKLSGKRAEDRDAWLAERNRFTLLALEGLPAEDNAMTRAMREAQYGTLSQDQINQVRNISRDYVEIKRSLGGGDPARAKLLFDEMNKDLLLALGEDAYKDYQLHSSPEAERLKSNLHNIDITEAEYTKLAENAVAAESFKYSPAVGTPAAVHGRAVEIDSINNTRPILGDDRFAAYVVASDPMFRELKPLLTSGALTSSLLIRTWDSVSSYRTRIEETSFSATLSNEEKVAGVASLANQLKKELNTRLSPSEMQQLSNTLIFRWIDNISKRR